MYFCSVKKLLYLIIFLPFLFFGQAPGCPDIQVDDETVDCNNPCVDLVATNLHTGETTQYEVNSIPYAPPYPFTGGTSAFIGTDDCFSGIIPLPFDFCFYGNTYNQLLIGANGLISFDASLANLKNNKTQCGGAIFLSDQTTYNPVEFYSKKLRRVAKSTFSSELFGLSMLLDSLLYFSSILGSLFSHELIVYVDCNSIVENLNN